MRKKESVLKEKASFLVNETINNMEYEKRISSAEREATSLRKEYQTQDTYRVQLENEVRMPRQFRKPDWSYNFFILIRWRKYMNSIYFPVHILGSSIVQQNICSSQFTLGYLDLKPELNPFDDSTEEKQAYGHWDELVFSVALELNEFIFF